ncbi:MAG: hypothetical protein IPI60_20585 [Saprospiraceae bacterium]|nr:hypothetical protein [Saprospiraceae bacterium]
MTCDDAFKYGNSPSWDCTEDYIPSSNIIWHHKDSDGVVLAESAMNIPQRTAPPQIIRGSTHMRTRNDEQLKHELTRIFTGAVGEFFITEVKIKFKFI